MDQLTDQLPVNESLMDCELELFRAIVDGSHVAVAITDDEDRIQYWNHAAENLFGYRAEETLGVELHGLIFSNESDSSPENKHAATSADHKFDTRSREVHGIQSGHGNGSNIDKSDNATDDGSDDICELRCMLSDGRVVWVELNERAISAGGRDWRIFLVRNVQARKKRELELEQAAQTDPLSGLVNRREFQTVLETECESDSPICLAFIDIDYFKKVNDHYGHLYGDEAIVLLSRQMERAFPDAVVISRLGGDEFGVLLKFDGDSDVIKKRFKSFCLQMAGITFSDQSLAISVSIGVAIAQNNWSARELLTVADKCTYEAKKAGRNRVRFRESKDEDSSCI